MQGNRGTGCPDGFQQIERFTYHGCPRFDILSYLFEKLGEFSSFDFHEPLTSALIRKENFRFENKNDRRILEYLIHQMSHLMISG